MAIKSDTVSNFIKHGYEGTVKFRALTRAGGCNNLNGHILEIMGADKTNLNPVNWVRGISEKLTSSPTATTVDSVVMKGGKVISRVQYKDTPKGIADTIRRVKSGQYNSATLKGTTETARKFNAAAEKAGIAKRMEDTGISGRTTKALGRACGACKQTSLARACAWSARSGDIWGGAISGGISVVSNIAVIAMDGDRMGRNLSKFAKAEEHRDFSGALARFATAVEGVVRNYGGELIYAGGDDVLAVTEAKQAIECAKELRRKFGEVKGFGGTPLTASAGIAVGHEKVPLQDLIHAAHSAESRAKNDYGRNALALDVYKRSGEILNWGCNWGDNCDSKALEVLEKLSESRGGLPVRFPYKLAELLMPYGKIDSSLKGVVELEFDHAWERSAGAEVPAAIKSAADAYLEECCEQDRINDFLALFLCDTFIARERDKKGVESK